ncbi:MAG: 4Fe-4S binding protein [Clostridia bacterium]
MKKHSKLQFIRRIVQVLGFVFYSGAWALTFQALSQIYLRITTGAPAGAELFAYLAEAIAIIPVTILFGRFFCGWLCAFGSLGDFIYSISSKFFTKKMPAKTDAALKYVKYGVFAIVAVVLWTGLLSTTEVLSPWDSFARIFLFQNDASGIAFKLALPVMSVGTILLVMMMAGSMFVERFFCRYLCPLGAFFSVTSLLRVFKIKKPTASCGSCRSCTNNCPMGINLYEKEKIGSGECIMCMKCTTVCAKSNTKLGVYAADLSPAIAAGIAVSTMVGAYSIDKQLEARANANQPSITEVYNPSNRTKTPVVKAAPARVRYSEEDDEEYRSAPALSQRSAATRPATPVTAPAAIVAPATSGGVYKNGTFTGTADGFNGPLSVSVNIANDKITSVVVGANSDYPNYLNRAQNKVIPAAVSAQSTNVSGASGATYSSNGIKNAVANALMSAKI